ncbi:MAG: D-alanine--D-alanine ligase [Lachnospiraceae bacterium]|nr:D-alanine--D-alanine ligase [Lachnospiraceae bacterium]
MKTKVAVLFGGKSVEHEVSVISGIQAVRNMDPEKYEITTVYITKKNEFYVGEDTGKIEAYRDIPALLKNSKRVILLNEENRVVLKQYPAPKFGKGIEIPVDVVFPVVHGTNEEDGTLQGYLKTIGVPFVGCDVTASAVGMDKYVSKAILKENGIPVLDCLLFTTSQYAETEKMLDEIEEKIGYPVIIKPVNLGSSVGIVVAKDRAELTDAVDTAFLYARRILAEHAILNLREVNCSVLGDENEAIASECEEPLHSADILSYEDKYMSGSSKSGGSKGMAGVSRKIPADITPEMKADIQKYAIKAFQSFGCNGVARIDFMIDSDNGKLYFNEINTIPGSLAFYLWEAVGMPYRELIDRLIALALKRDREEKSVSYTFDTNILAGANLGGSKKLPASGS